MHHGSQPKRLRFIAKHAELRFGEYGFCADPLAVRGTDLDEICTFARDDRERAPANPSADVSISTWIQSSEVSTRGPGKPWSRIASRIGFSRHFADGLHCRKARHQAYPRLRAQFPGKLPSAARPRSRYDHRDSSASRDVRACRSIRASLCSHVRSITVPVGFCVQRSYLAVDDANVGVDESRRRAR